jgi:hypothetical protein
MFEIKHANQINFLKDKYDFEIGNRKVYKCQYKNESVKLFQQLNDSSLYYVTNECKNSNNGAYIILYFQEKTQDLIFFKFFRKPNEDIESVEYIALCLVKKLGFDIKDYKRSDSGVSYYKY